MDPTILHFDLSKIDFTNTTQFKQPFQKKSQNTDTFFFLLWFFLYTTIIIVGAAKSQIGALLGSIARRSEYQLDWSGAHHLCVAFEGGQKVVHKVYKQLIMMHGRNGSLTWNDPVSFKNE